MKFGPISLPMLRYGAETWTLKVALEKKPDAFQQWYLSSFRLQLPVTVHISQAEICRHARQTSFSEMTETRRP